MTSFKQIEANRRNVGKALVRDEGKLRSRRNAIRHALTAETVIMRWRMRKITKRRSKFEGG